MNRFPRQTAMLAIAVFGSALFTFALFGSARLMAGDKTDESTKVTATVTLPKELASFTDRTLELRLYEYDPLLADVGADLVEKISKDPFSHSEGKATELTIEIGAKGKVKPRRRYYLTTFVLDGDSRTHLGEKDGKRGLCQVISDGHPRKVKIVVRSVR